MERTLLHIDRRGITLIECTVAAVVMTTLLVLLGQAVGWVAAARRDADRRQVALLEASNVLEQVTALPFVAIDADHVAKTGLSDHARELLGADSLLVDVQTDDEGPLAKRVAVAVQYGDRAAARQTVRLTAWVYQRGGP